MYPFSANVLSTALVQNVDGPQNDAFLASTNRTNDVNVVSPSCGLFLMYTSANGNLFFKYCCKSYTIA